MSNTIDFTKRKNDIDEMLKCNPDIKQKMVEVYFSSTEEPNYETACKHFDNKEHNKVAEAIRADVVGRLIRKKVREIVRKKAGGGGYALYAPNKGKKKAATVVGNFPTKLGAKRAELMRFPPKDPIKLKRIRDYIKKLMSDPKKAAEREKMANKEIGTDKRNEGIKLLRGVIANLIKESLFNEELAGSEWDEYITKLSKQALIGDKKFQAYQKAIENKTEEMLNNSFNSIRKAIGKDAKLKSSGIKKSHNHGKAYISISALIDNVAVEPIYVYIENGIPKIEISDNAKISLTKVDSDSAKLFRAELVTVQERVLDKMDDLTKTIESRDKYLEKLEDGVDGFVAGLTPLQISLLKQLLVKKYRGKTS